MEKIPNIPNKWVYGVIAFSIVTIAIYLLMPVFRFPIFGEGADSGIGYIKVLWQIDRTAANLISFTLPVIGSVGAAICAVWKGRGIHILSVAFASLPLIFYVYLLLMLSHLTVVSEGDSFVSLFLDKGFWLGAASSILALISALLLVTKDNALYKKQITHFTKKP